MSQKNKRTRRLRNSRPPVPSSKAASAGADLSVALGPLRLANPVMVASGTFGGAMDRVLDVASLGAVVEKTVTMEPRTGNPYPRVWETPAGMLNSIGLDNPGVEAWVRKRYPEIESFPCPVIVSVSGRTEQEFGTLVRRLDGLRRVDAFELNLSCPNVSHGTDFAVDPARTERVVRACRKATRKPIFAKLTPNVTDIAAVARGAAAGGADGIAAINTLKGMAVDWRRGAPCLGGTTGGLSGPAIRPVAIRAVWEIASALPRLPIIGIGGIATAEDVLEFLAAGAWAVQVGTGNFTDPHRCERIVAELPTLLAAAGGRRIRDLVGACRRK